MRLFGRLRRVLNPHACFHKCSKCGYSGHGAGTRIAWLGWLWVWRADGREFGFCYVARSYKCRCISTSCLVQNPRHLPISIPFFVAGPFLVVFMLFFCHLCVWGGMLTLDAVATWNHLPTQVPPSPSSPPISPLPYSQPNSNSQTQQPGKQDPVLDLSMFPHLPRESSGLWELNPPRIPPTPIRISSNIPTTAFFRLTWRLHRSNPLLRGEMARRQGGMGHRRCRRRRLPPHPPWRPLSRGSTGMRMGQSVYPIVTRYLGPRFLAVLPPPNRNPLASPFLCDA
jgi:hypothetical protein